MGHGVKKHPFTTFLCATESPYPAAIFRLLAAGVILLNLFLLRNSVSDFYGSNGFMNWEATKPLVFKYSMTVERLLSYLRGYRISEGEIVNSLYFGFVICSLFLLLGLFTRISAVVAWVISLTLAYTGKGTFYGMPLFLHISLFYLIIMPTNVALSLDAVIFKRFRKEQVRSFTRKLLQFHMAVVYASSGIEKTVGVQWWNGEAIWRSLNTGPYMQYDMAWLAYYPIIPVLLGISTLILEIGYLAFIWVPKVRVVWLFLTILLHISIIVFLGLYLFGLVMIILNISAFGPEAYKDIKAYSSKKGRAKQVPDKNSKSFLTR